MERGRFPIPNFYESIFSYYRIEPCPIKAVFENPPLSGKQIGRDGSTVIAPDLNSIDLNAAEGPKNKRTKFLLLFY